MWILALGPAWRLFWYKRIRRGCRPNTGDALKPQPVLDQKGECSTTWDCGRYASRKLIKEGVTSIQVIDEEYNVLAHDSILIYAE